MKLVMAIIKMLTAKSKLLYGTQNHPQTTKRTRFSWNTKLTFYKIIAKQDLLYGCECWVVTWKQGRLTEAPEIET